MLTIDGSHGEGGGQILRSALALAMVTGRPFHIRNIRAGRKKPGLLRQHLTAAVAAAKVSDAQLDGAFIGARELWFRPQAARAGAYHFAVGSAGSAALVLQTVLPALLVADGPSSLRLEGGTHNPHAPPVDFLQLAFLPILNRMGPRVQIRLERHGFYPAGGGRFTVEIEPASKLEPVDLRERGEVRRRLARVVVAGLPREIGDRELAAIQERLNWPEETCQLRHLAGGHGPGNVLMLEVECREVTEVFTGFGQRGVRAEAVAQHAAREAEAYLAAPAAAVGTHLADQLLVPFALAGGGSYTTLPPTLHARTNIEVAGMFLDAPIDASRLDEQVWEIRVGRKH